MLLVFSACLYYLWRNRVPGTHSRVKKMWIGVRKGIVHIKTPILHIMSGLIIALGKDLILSRIRVRSFLSVTYFLFYFSAFRYSLSAETEKITFFLGSLVVSLTMKLFNESRKNWPKLFKRQGKLELILTNIIWWVTTRPINPWIDAMKSGSSRRFPPSNRNIMINHRIELFLYFALSFHSHISLFCSTTELTTATGRTVHLIARWTNSTLNERTKTRGRWSRSFFFFLSF